jgi:adenosylcobinamide-GDP ribazoletransferase
VSDALDRSRPLRDLGLAVSLMTVIPTPARWSADGPKPDVAGWFPVAGLLTGAVGWGLVHALEALGWRHSAPALVAAVVVALWALFTRLLHHDGLADVADAFWGGHSAERRLEIMADSATGAFGASAIVLVALLEVTAVAAILGAGHASPLLIAVGVSRLAATLAAWLGKPARPGGLGDSIARRPGWAGATAAVVVTVSCLAAGWVGLGAIGLGVVVLEIGAALVIPHLIAERMGGVTGDVMGASVMLTETFGLVAFAFATAVFS